MQWARISRYPRGPDRKRTREPAARPAANDRSVAGGSRGPLAADGALGSVVYPVTRAFNPGPETNRGEPRRHPPPRDVVFVPAPTRAPDVGQRLRRRRSREGGNVIVNSNSVMSRGVGGRHRPHAAGTGPRAARQPAAGRGPRGHTPEPLAGARRADPARRGLRAPHRRLAAAVARLLRPGVARRGPAARRTAVPDRSPAPRRAGGHRDRRLVARRDPRAAAPERAASGTAGACRLERYFALAHAAVDETARSLNRAARRPEIAGHYELVGARSG